MDKLAYHKWTQYRKCHQVDYKTCLKIFELNITLDSLLLGLLKSVVVLFFSGPWNFSVSPTFDLILGDSGLGWA